MTLVGGLVAVATATLVIFGYLIFIWWLDRYEREPFWMVLLTFIWGAVGATTLGCILSVVMNISLMGVADALYADFISAVVVAPLAEEFTKGLFFGVLVLTPFLDNETDGLIYGAAAGLGFAAVENLLYYAGAALTSPDVLLYLVVMRTAFTALVHTISSALLGFTIGYVRHRRLTPWLWMLPLVGFALAVLNHALWNLLATVADVGLVGEATAAGALNLGILLVVVMSVVMFLICQLSLRREHKIIEKYLRQEAEKGVLPREHARIIPYWSRRRRRDWVPANVPHKPYLEAATLLAFRRYQAETAAPRFEQKYRQEVETYRKRVQDLLRQPSERSQLQPGGSI